MKTPTFDELTNVRLLSGGRYAPDGRHFAYLANTTGRLQIWMQPTGGGFARQLTALPDRRATDFRWSPDSSMIAFAADLDGDEMHQLFVMDVSGDSGSWPRQLTDRPDVQFELAGWTPDGRIICSGNDRNPRDVDPQIIDPATGESLRLLENGVNYAAEASPDGKWLTAISLYSNSDTDIILINLETGEHRNLTAHEGKVRHFADRWAADSSGFNMLTDLDSEFLHLRFHHLRTGESTIASAPERDIDGLVLSPDNRVIVTIENDNGASVLTAFDLEARQEISTAPLPYGVINSLSIHPDGDTLLMGMTTAREPTNIFEFGLRSGRLERREQAMLGGVNPSGLTEPALISYPSFDRDIPAWLFLPEGSGPFPAVLSVHGGPEAQERPSYAYQGLYQYLLTRGIAVLAPNIRGSTGYGKTYQQLIQRDWGGGELKDIEAAAKWLQEQPWADPERLAIWGASFGGFATLSALSRDEINHVSMGACRSRRHAPHERSLTMIKGIHHIVLFCADTAKSREWYEQVGFVFKRGYDGMYWFALGLGEIMLHPGGAGADAVAPTIHVTVERLDELFARVIDAGLKPFDHQRPDAALSGPVVRPWGDREFELQDPDGHVWAFTEETAEAV